MALRTGAIPPPRFSLGMLSGQGRGAAHPSDGGLVPRTGSTGGWECRAGQNRRGRGVFPGGRRNFGRASQPQAQAQAQGQAQATSAAAAALPPAEAALPPRKQRCPLRKQRCPPRKQRCPPTEAALPPAEAALPPAEAALPPAEAALPPRKQRCPPRKQRCPPRKQPCPLRKQPAPRGSSVAPSEAALPPRGRLDRLGLHRLTLMICSSFRALPASAKKSSSGRRKFWPTRLSHLRGTKARHWGRVGRSLMTQEERKVSMST